MSVSDASEFLQISLSAREIEIIELVASGLTNQEIADRLTISKRTVICRDGFNCCSLPEDDNSSS